MQGCSHTPSGLAKCAHTRNRCITVNRFKPLVKELHEGHDLIGDQTRVTRRDLSALDVLLLQAHSEGIHPREGVDGVLEAVVDHVDDGDLVVADCAYLLEDRFEFVSPSSAW